MDGGVSPIGPIPSLPLNLPKAGTDSPSPAPLPIVIPDRGTASENLLNRNVIILLPQFLFSRGAEAMLTPSRILAHLMQINARQKGENKPYDLKEVTLNRDEATAKGNTAKGEDLTNIQVFKGEKGSEGLLNREQQYGKNQPPQAASSSKSMDPQLAVMPDSSKSLEKGLQDEHTQVSKSNDASGVPSAKETVPSNVPQEKGSQNEKSLKSETDRPLEKESSQGEKNAIAFAKNEGGNSTHALEKAVLPQESKSLSREDPSLKESKMGEQRIAIAKLKVPPESSLSDKQFVDRPEIREKTLERPKDNSGHTLEKVKDRERVDEVVREDKMHHLEHPAGHRVLSHGRAEYRANDAAPQVEPHIVHRAGPETDLVIPLWLTIFNQEQEQQERIRRSGKSGGFKQTREMVEHRLADLLFMLLCSVIGGSRTIFDCLRFISAREKWFQVVLGSQCKLPEKEVFWRLLTFLNPNNYEQALLPWLEEVCGQRSRITNSGGTPVLPAVSLWLSPLGLLFGQAKASSLSQDSWATRHLLKLFNFDGAVIMAKMASVDYDAADAIARSGAGFIVGIDSESATAERLDELMLHAANSRSSKYSLSESYIEGKERLILEALMKDEETFSLDLRTSANVGRFVKIGCETIGQSGSAFKAYYFLIAPKTLPEDAFDLLRIQMPLDRNLGWVLNTMLPVQSLKSGFRQCTQCLEYMHNFAVGLLMKYESSLTMREKMQLVAKDNNELLKVFSASRSTLK